MKPIVCSFALAYLLWLSCTPAPMHARAAGGHLASLPKRAMPGEFGGVCDIRVRGEKLRTRARIRYHEDGVAVALVDELGVALALVTADSSGTEVAKTFPPMGHASAGPAGIYMRALLLAIEREYRTAGVFVGDLLPEHTVLVYAGGRTPDSLHVRKQAGHVYAGIISASRYVVLSPSRDTLMVFSADTPFY
ncbi:MAG: hypothetical protein GF418_10480 [Chitinivibrionales bacterium]|nr:hypothetical protein [Chitinivibrionales bacterium]MBD3396039.1 hypothetical protein [Chitinivibrionales bacterium]